MSSMDGMTPVEDLIETAYKWGHKAIAITDHNGVQGFPHVFNLVTGYNKGLEEGKEPFKVIYGAELVMIDDAVNIVLRPNKEVMLDQTFVVFDFETTGFNAGGADSIIEVGAVKIRNGEIIEKYDFNMEMACRTYEDLLKLILKSPSRQYFEKQMLKDYAPQVELAVKYAKKVFGEDFPPY